MATKEKRQLLVVIACVLDVEPDELRHKKNHPTEVPRPKVLLVQRQEAKQPDLDLRWELPGGKVNINERPEIAIAREILEETGYHVSIREILPFTFTATRDYKRYIQQTIIFCFICVVDNDFERLTVQDSKVKESKWYDFNEIDYSNVLAGSQDFLLYVADMHEIRLIEVDPLVSSATFIRQDPTKNINREYSITIRVRPGADIAFRYSVLFRTKRHGAEGWEQETIKLFDSSKEAYIEIRKRLKRRRLHGYKLWKYTSNFPLQGALKPFDLYNKPYQLELFGKETVEPIVLYDNPHQMRLFDEEE